VENWLNVPNMLTMLRMVMVCFMPGLFRGAHYGAAMALFLAAGATDLLDGYIARKYQLITSFGKLMDPLADKLMLVVTLLLFAEKGWTPMVIPILVMIKELVMIVGSALLLKKHTVVFSNALGKTTTFIFTVAVVLTFLHERVYPVDLIMMWAGFALSMAALVSYGLRFVLNKSRH
jgi:cardiolipin synthase